MHDAASSSSRGINETRARRQSSLSQPQGHTEDGTRGSTRSLLDKMGTWELTDGAASCPLPTHRQTLR